MTTTSSRKRSRGFRMRVNSKPAPVAFGVQSLITMPLGTYVKERRTGDFANRAGAANAGVIASSIGSATTAPMPFKKVRRGRCFRVTIIAGTPLRRWPSSDLLLTCDSCVLGVLGQRARFERQAVHDLQDHGGELVLVRREPAGNQLDRLR